MSNQQVQMKQIRRLIGIWISEIRLNSYEGYTDINKVSEHLSRQLLNKIYDYQLEDLNRVKVNFPGLDIGDDKKDLVAYQITSRTDRKKVIENLESVVKNSFHKTFTKGIRFFILNDTAKISFGPKSKKTPAGILSSFKIEDDIIYPQDLIKKIEDIYEKEADLFKFNQIKLLLEKDLILIASGKENPSEKKENEVLKNLLFATLEKLTADEDKKVKISPNFFHGDLKVPKIIVISPRQTLVEKVWNDVKTHDIIWIQGAPSTGKTSLAILLSKLAEKTLWIECRDIQPEQLMEHIINSLLCHFNLPLSDYYEQTLDDIAWKLDLETLIILNDLPDIHKNILLQQHFGKLISYVRDKEVDMVATSNYDFPVNIAQTFDLNIDLIHISPFEEADTASVLKEMGATEETAILFSSVITGATEGHPLLIQSAVKYLKEKMWVMDDETISKLFSGKFGDTSEKESYIKVLSNTTDPHTRDLLYRLRYVIGDIDFETIQLVCSVEPAIMHPGEKVIQVKGIWLKEIGEGKFQLSPLIKYLDGNVQPAVEKEIYNQLAIQLIKKKNISQIDAFKVIYYFSKGEQYNHAAFILFRVLTEFMHQPKLFFQWGFDLYWWNETFPEEVDPLFKVQVRIMQISMCIKLNRKADYLIADLRDIIATEDIGLLGHAASNLLFFQIELMPDPILAFTHLSKAQSEFKEIEESPFETDIFNEEIMNGIWVVFSQIHSRKDYEEWFRLFKTIDISASLTDSNTNDIYVMAAVAIYRNAVLKSKNSGEDIDSLLRWLIDTSFDCGLVLLSVYSLKYLFKYLEEDLKDWSAALKLIETYESIWKADSLYKFIFFVEIGSRYFYDNKMEDADYYFSEIKNIEMPGMYTEALDYLIAYMQVADKKDQEFSAALTEKALDMVLQGTRYLLEDKVKLYGELAITTTRKNNLKQALYLYEKGYIELLENFTNSDEQQALIIRYGNALKYLIELLENGVAVSFGVEKNIIPETGYFYRPNNKLLEGGFYFDERKFFSATLLQAGFESLGEVVSAKKWFYKSFELSQELMEPKYIAVLQANLFYLVQDKQFKQGYNVQAYIDNYYNQLKQKLADGVLIDNELNTKLQNLKVNDLGVYFFLMLPIAFSFSIDVVQDRVQKEQYRMMIDDAFSNDQYQIKDAASFIFAKRLFEGIMIDNISYAQMQKLFQTYQGEYTNIFYIIGCILLSSFTDATESANLHLAIIGELEKTMQQSRAMYRFCMAPYFVEFWPQKLLTHPRDFFGKEHLRTKGFALIEKTELQKKIPTLFRVLSNHLDVSMSSEVSNFIEIS